LSALDMTARKYQYILITLALFAILNLSANAQQVTLKLERRPIVELFKQIQIQTGYSIVYSNEVFSDSMLVSIDANKINVNKLLDTVLASKHLFSQTLSQSLIVIRSREVEQQKFQSNQLTIAGKVMR